MAVYKYKVYHDSYSNVVDEIEKWLKSLPFDYDEEDLTFAYMDAFFKPKEGKTKKDIISLYSLKTGNLARKAASISVYNMGVSKKNKNKDSFELNMYAN